MQCPLSQICVSSETFALANLCTGCVSCSPEGLDFVCSPKLSSIVQFRSSTRKAFVNFLPAPCEIRALVGMRDQLIAVRCSGDASGISIGL